MKLRPGLFHLHVYSQLLRAQIPKAKKDSQVISVFLRFWDLCAKRLPEELPVK